MSGRAENPSGDIANNRKRSRSGINQDDIPMRFRSRLKAVLSFIKKKPGNDLKLQEYWSILQADFEFKRSSDSYPGLYKAMGELSDQMNSIKSACSKQDRADYAQELADEAEEELKEAQKTVAEVEEEAIAAEQKSSAADEDCGAIKSTKTRDVFKKACEGAEKAHDAYRKACDRYADAKTKTSELAKKAESYKFEAEQARSDAIFERYKAKDVREVVEKIIGFNFTTAQSH
ncbi:hypothetical protein ONZ43_g1104 [Nemania bipapillata]|uniref:Uncharacterized protein n=1 Tax=Nemania bipapillata TaxID=110536 RepID=A0ACC2J5T7_9PEZI|nr:hypothetical protein ONZ43_g1104 [Nemania bipapillata]